MAGKRRKTQEQVFEIVRDAGIETQTLNETSNDWNDSVAILQTLVNDKKLFVSDLQHLAQIEWPVKPAPKKKKSTEEVSDGKVDVASIMLRLLRENHEETYNELKIQVVDVLLAQKRQEMLNSLPI